MITAKVKLPYNILSFVSDSLSPALEVLGFYSVYSSPVVDIQPTHFFRFHGSPSRQVCIIRGIGYRAQLLHNFCAGNHSQPSIFTATQESGENFSDLFFKETLFTGNDTDWSAVNTYEFPNSRYLSLRVGHSDHLYFPIPNFLGVKISKKDRKLVIYGFSTSLVSTFMKFIYS